MVLTIIVTIALFVVIVHQGYHLYKDIRKNIEHKKNVTVSSDEKTKIDEQ